MRIIVTLFSIILGLTLSSPAYAIAYCSGTLQNVYLTKDGAVVTFNSWVNNYTQVCNLEEVWKGVPPQVCWGWFAQINTAVSESRSVIIDYANPLETSDCPTLPVGGNTPGPVYFMLQ